MNQFDAMDLVYFSLLAAAVSAQLFVMFHGRIGEALRSVLSWLLIFVGVIAAYGLWDNVRDTVLPHRIASQTENSVILKRQPDGHFYADLSVNGHKVRFLVDTGATGLVLARKDAEAADIEVSGLSYFGWASTANGMVRTAPIWIEELRLGSLVNHRIQATVTDGKLDTSLLGQSYLSRFDKVIIEGDIMTLEIRSSGGWS